MADKRKDSKESKKNGLSRRRFIKGAGLTAAGTAMLQGSVLAFEEGIQQASGKIYSPDGASIAFKVNGELKSVTVEPRNTLSEVLRDKLDLTGTKIVCDRGSCSACTVLVNGKPVNSCLTMAIDVHGKEVTTIEGIATNGELHPVQEAFIEYDATQCGYCTSGMVVSCVHLLQENPNPDLQEVKNAIRGHLCRCGTYPNVFKAAMAASKKIN